MIQYVSGDATEPIGEGKKLICHVTNNISAWGAGFVLALSKKWPEPEEVYRKTKHYLGEVQFIPVESNIIVANMCCQNGIKQTKRNGGVLIDYDYLEWCLEIVDEFYYIYNIDSIHMPKIGSGLAGGDWNIIEEIIENKLINKEVIVYEY